MTERHDPEMCPCEACIKRLLKANDRYMKAWLRRALGESPPPAKEG